MLQSRSEKIANYIIIGLLIMFCFTVLYPFLNILAISFNVGTDTQKGGITLWPRAFTTENYYVVLHDSRLLNSFFISVARTVLGTASHIFFTAMFGYAMSKKYLLNRKFYMIFSIFTMYFSGGLIPVFLLFRDLKLIDTFWVMVIPNIISVWDMIIFRTFFSELPVELEESAKLDGCNDYLYYFKIAIPLSTPVIAAVSVFNAIYHWNSWFDAAVFINNEKLLPIQTMLNNIINANTSAQMLMEMNASAQELISKRQQFTSKSLVSAAMMVTTIPIIFVYPFAQKYFTKGIMVGSLKG